MIIWYWSVKGGVGTSVVAAATAIRLASEDHGATLVDLVGDQPALLGMISGSTPSEPGIGDWVAAGDRVAADAIGRLLEDVAPGLRLLRRGTGLRLAAQAAPDSRSASAAQAASDSRSASAAQAASDSRSASAAQAASDSRSASAAQAASDSRSASAAQAASDSRSASAAQAASDSRSASAAQAASDSRSASAAQAASDSRPGSAAQAASDSRPGQVSQAAPDSRPGSAAQAAPDSRPGQVSQTGDQPASVHLRRRLLLALEVLARSGPVVVDAGLDPAGLRSDLGGGSPAVCVLRACYLALSRAQRTAGPYDRVVLVEEPGRALRSRDVAAAVGASHVERIAWDPRVARSVDAGTIVSMLPPPLRRFELPT